jgi:hypothetical protein
MPEEHHRGVDVLTQIFSPCRRAPQIVHDEFLDVRDFEDLALANTPWSSTVPTLIPVGE